MAKKTSRKPAKSARKTKMSWTWAWYLLPILFSLLGGVVGYFILRKKDNQLAKRLFWTGLAVFVILLVYRISMLA